MTEADAASTSLRIAVVTLFPELVTAVTACGVTGRAAERGLLELSTFNPRDYTRDRHRSVDDTAYGGGPGMVMMFAPMVEAIEAARTAIGADAHRVLLSPQGRPLSQAGLQALLGRQRLVLIAGRYEGVDERVTAAAVDEELSLGDFVLSGGEIGAMAVIDGLARLLPGALGDERSAQQDSFVDGLLDYPHYTRPESIGEARVPPVLAGGNHAEIDRWRRRQALGRTLLRRPELLAAVGLDETDRALLQGFIDELPEQFQ